MEKKKLTADLLLLFQEFLAEMRGIFEIYWSGSWKKGECILKDFESYIKNYSTRDFIYFFSEVSIGLYKKQTNKSDEESECTITFPINIISHGFMHRQVSVTLEAWDIPNMAYVSIIKANDYRKEIMSEEKAGKVVGLYRKYENEHSNSEYIKKASLQEVFKLIMGMSYEQFKYQNLAWTYQNFNRNYHILIGSSKIKRDAIIDINEITKELFGLSADEYLVNVCCLLWLCSLRPDPLGAEEALYERWGNNIFTKNNLEKIIDYYTVTYDEVRKSQIKKQLFYSKPFVITQKKKETIMISMYLVQMLFADGLYWLIRDYYYKNGKGSGFVNAFGTMFEEYFKELADLYLTKDMWRKIPEQDKKSADFFVEFEDAVFLFELKSGLLGIKAKQQVPDIDQIDMFYKRNILEAYEQLKMSEKEYQGEKPVIKILLLYESMTNTQMIMSSIPEIFFNDSRCYVMTIEDLEMMFATYKKDKGKFAKIVRTLVENQNNHGQITSVLHILNDYDAVGDMHFIGERDYLAKIVERMKQ